MLAEHESFAFMHVQFLIELKKGKLQENDEKKGEKNCVLKMKYES